jgi:hypothetical protein
MDVGPDAGRHTTVVSGGPPFSARVDGGGVRQTIVLNAALISQLEGSEAARNQNRYVLDVVAGDLY